jgi:hypothetical protein
LWENLSLAVSAYQKHLALPLPIVVSKLDLTHLHDSVFSKGIFPEVCLHLNAVVKEFRLSTGESYRSIPIDNKRQDDDDYDPCASGNSVVDVNIDGKAVVLGLWDTVGQEHYDRLRRLSYSETNVFLICFAIDSVETLESIQKKVSQGPIFQAPKLLDLTRLLQVDCRGPAFRSRYSHHLGGAARLIFDTERRSLRSSPRNHRQ